MKINLAFVASLTAFAYSSVFVGCATVGGPVARGEKKLLPASEIIANLSGKKLTELSVSEATDLSLAKLVKGDIAAARECARIGAQKATTPGQKAIFYGLISKTYGIEGKYREAANAALEGQQIDPTSVELAACRFEYFSQLPGEAAQIRSAENQLRTLDPNYKRQAVAFDPVTGVAILVTVKIVVDKVVIPLLMRLESQWAKTGLDIARTASDMLGVAGVVAGIALDVTKRHP